MYKCFKTAIFETVVEALDTKSGRNKYVKKLRVGTVDFRGEKKAHKKWLSDKSLQSRQEYVRIRHRVKVMVAQEKKEHWQKQCKSIHNTISCIMSIKAWSHNRIQEYEKQQRQ